MSSPLDVYGRPDFRGRIFQWESTPTGITEMCDFLEEDDSDLKYGTALMAMEIFTDDNDQTWLKIHLERSRELLLRQGDWVLRSERGKLMAVAADEINALIQTQPDRLASEMTPGNRPAPKAVAREEAEANPFGKKRAV